MKKTLIALFAVAGLVQAASLQIDFGRYDSTTDGFYNICVEEGFTTGSVVANYVNGASSATTEHNLVLGEQNVTLTYTHTTGIGNAGGLGLMPTLTTSEENGWKNAYTGDLPTGITGNLYDALTTQAASNAGSHTLTFTGLAAGTYSLVGFGAYYGNDDMSPISISLGGLTADWSGQSCAASTWTNIASVEDSSSIAIEGDATQNANHGYYFSANNIVVGDEGSITLTISGSDGWERTPLNYISLQAVPEPATASLSLLGLAALMIRRRR